MLTSLAFAGAAALSIMVNGVPLQATYLQSDRDGCQIAHETARRWQKSAGIKPVQTQLDGWCTVGAVISNQWVSEQWRTQMVNGKSSGWRIVIALDKQAGASAESIRSVGLGVDPWHLDVIDNQIATRIRYRQSLKNLDQHHQDSHRATGRLAMPSVGRAWTDHPLRLSQHRNGEILLSGRHPDGGSYSVFIERGLEK